MLLLILSLLLIFLFGFNFVSIFDKKLYFLEKLALAWVIGVGLTTQGMFLLTVLNVSYSKLSLFMLLVFSNLILLFKKRKKFKLELDLNKAKEKLAFSLKRGLEDFSVFEYLLILSVLFFGVSVFIFAVFWPVYYWDALALYDYRAKIFFEAGGIAKSAVLSSLPMHSYPPLTSLIHTFVYFIGGIKANPQFVYPLFYWSLLIMFYYSLINITKRWLSLLFTFFLGSIPFFIEFASNAYTNLPYALYFGMGTVYLFRSFKEERYGLLVISGLLLGFSGWTRSPSEQFFVVNLLVLVYLCFKQRKYYFAPLLLTFLFIVLAEPWRLYVYSVLKIDPITKEVTQAAGAGLSSFLNFDRFSDVVSLLYESTKYVSGTSIFLVLMTSIFYPKYLKKNFGLFLFILLNLVVFVTGSYFLSLSWVDWEDSIRNSAHRLSMFLPPIALYFVAITVPDFLKNKNV